MTKLNRDSTWPLRIHLINKLSFPWVTILVKDLSRIHLHILSILTRLLKASNLTFALILFVQTTKASSYQQTMWLQIPISRRLKNISRCPLLQTMRAFPPPDSLSLSPTSKSWASHTLLTNPTFISLLKILNASSRTIISLMISFSHQNHTLSRSPLNRTWLSSGLTYGIPKTVTMLRKLLTGASI